MRSGAIFLSSKRDISLEEIEAHYSHSPFIKEICVVELAGRASDPGSERLHAVIVPNFDVLRERKIVNVHDVVRFDIENLSLELPIANRITSFNLWRGPLPRTETRALNRTEITRRVQTGASDDFSGSTAEQMTGEDEHWLSDARVQRAIAAIRQSSKAHRPVLPSSNLELDLGFDSIERVELLVALESYLGVEVDARVISDVYTVRELVDTILKSGRCVANPAAASDAGWDTVLAMPPDDPRVLSALRVGLLTTLAWFVFGKFVSLLAHVFFRLRVSGRDKLPHKGPLILSPNHQSFIDPPIVASQIPWRLFKSTFYLGTTEIFGRGIFGFLSRTFRLVQVDPDSNLVEGMRAAALGLKKGYNLVLYPEGERTIDGAPKTFKKGAAILSTHFKVPIYPVALEGFYEAWPRGQRFPRLSKLYIRFGDPILPPAGESSEDTCKQVTEKLRDRVVEMWRGLQKQTTQASAKSGA